MNISTLCSKKNAFVALLAVCFHAVVFAQFTPNNLVVLQVGDGTETLLNTGNSLFLKEFTATGAAGISVAIPKTGANALLPAALPRLKV